MQILGILILAALSYYLGTIAGLFGGHFHKWSNWSELKQEVWVRMSGNMKYDYQRQCQTRTCKICNKIETRYMEVE